METNEIKALFFAQYIGSQPVQMTSNSEGILSDATYSDCVRYGLEKRWLMLRDIKSITQGEMKTFESTPEGLRIKYLQAIGVITAFLYIDNGNVIVMQIDTLLENHWAELLPLKS